MENLLKRIGLHSILYSASNLFPAFIAFFVIGIFTRYSSLESIADLFIFMSYSFFLTNFIAFGITNYFQKYVLQSKNLGNELLLCLIIFILMIFLYFIFQIIFPSSALYAFILINSFFMVAVNIVKSYYQVRSKAIKNFLFIAVINLAGLSFFFIFTSIFSIDLLNSRIYSYILMNFLGFIFFISFFYRKFFKIKKISLFKIKNFIKFGIGVVLHAAAMFVISQIDKIIIPLSYSKDSLALYSVASQYAAILQIFMGALSIVYMSSLYNYLSKKINKKPSSLYFILIGISILAMIIYAFLVYFLIGYFLGSSFDFNYILFCILLLSNFFFGLYQFNTHVFYYHERTDLLSYITSALAIFIFAASYFLSLHYGYIVISYVSLLTFIMSFILTSYIGNSFNESKKN